MAVAVAVKVALLQILLLLILMLPILARATKNRQRLRPHVERIQSWLNGCEILRCVTLQRDHYPL